MAGPPLSGSRGRRHTPDFVPAGRAQIWAGICALLGSGMLIASFAVNPGPPAGDSGAQLTAFEQQHLDAILWGAWLQAAGPVFIFWPTSC